MRTIGSQRAISLARVPEMEICGLSPNNSRPAAIRSHVRGSISTTFGGVPRRCVIPVTHWMAANGGTRTSTLFPGAIRANSYKLARTAVANI